MEGRERREGEEGEGMGGRGRNGREGQEGEGWRSPLASTSAPASKLQSLPSRTAVQVKPAPDVPIPAVT